MSKRKHMTLPLLLVLTAVLSVNPAFVAAQPAAAAIPLTAALDDFTCADVSEIPQNECQALVALYNSTDGANWTFNAGWLNSTTPCTWFGVTCAVGHVSALALAENGLSGALPAEVGNLSGLQTLTLNRNELSGPLPSKLGDLANLLVLDLSENQISGSIPAELGNLANLQRLVLWDNALDGAAGGHAVPPSLSNLTNLQELLLSGNVLSGTLPSELGNLSNLQTLSLGDNRIGGSIPAGLGNLTNLQKLILSENQLSGSIPPQLGNLTNLLELWLSYNDLTGEIPAELGNLTNLRRLDLRRNRLEGSIPAALGNLSSLTELNLSSNRLSGSIPAALAGLASVQSFYLDSNQLGGDVPAELCNLSGWPELGLDFNKLNDGPACIDNLAFFWRETQTVPPTDVRAATVTSDTIDLAWTPIAYNYNDGTYEISYARAASGPFVVHGQTANKGAARYPMTDLRPGTTYYLRVRTFTGAHDTAPAFQQNDLWSDYSQVITATTAGSPPTISAYLPLLLVRKAASRRDGFLDAEEPMRAFSPVTQTQR